VKPALPRARIRLHGGPFARIANRLLRADAFVLGRRVFLSASAAREISRGTERGARILAHEVEHVAQYRRLGIPRFLIRYAADYLAGRLSGASHAAAYASIRFEREAERAAEAATAVIPVAEEALPSRRRRGA
jgi:hypothetical protein